jgi:hypothetical protein
LLLYFPEESKATQSAWRLNRITLGKGILTNIQKILSILSLKSRK